MSPEVLEGIFDSNVPEDFQQRTLQLLFQVYGQAHQDVGAKYHWPEDIYMLGHERHAQFNRDWRVLADSLQNPNIIATAEPNTTGNYHFTRVRCGRVYLTASVVGEIEVVRRALFRNAMALDSQMSLFPSDEVVDAASDSPIYSILIHSPSRSDRSVPSLAKFVFPTPLGKHELNINLMARFQMSIGGSVPEEQIPDIVQPEIIAPDDSQNEQPPT